MTCGCNGHAAPNRTTCSCNAFSSPVNPVTYTIADAAVGTKMLASKWTELRNYINTERARRGAGGVPDTGFSGKIEANDVNTLSSYINYYWSDGIYSVGTVIGASHLNYIIDKIQYCGSICVCNCNYCTCNCNYCTCNCNYACTCNCNYSDERLKTNITKVGVEKGLNIYSYNYVWDKKTVHRGVMAQELLNTEYKDAVITAPNGYYMVDYSKLPVKF